MRSLEHKNAVWRQTQVVLVAIISLRIGGQVEVGRLAIRVSSCEGARCMHTYHHRVHVHAISVQAFRFVQKHNLCLGRRVSHAIFELIQYHELQLLRLTWHKPKFGYCCRCCSALFIVTKFGYMEKIDKRKIEY